MAVYDDITQLRYNKYQVIINRLLSNIYKNSLLIGSDAASVVITDKNGKVKNTNNSGAVNIEKDFFEYFENFTFNDAIPTREDPIMQHKSNFQMAYENLASLLVLIFFTILIGTLFVGRYTTSIRLNDRSSTMMNDTQNLLHKDNDDTL